MSGVVKFSSATSAPLRFKTLLFDSSAVHWSEVKDRWNLGTSLCGPGLSACGFSALLGRDPGSKSIFN
jgi:hypothetical protein